MLNVNDINTVSDFLKIQQSDITRELLIGLFANFSVDENSSKFKFSDKLKIGKNQYYDNKEEIETTLGRYILNKAIIPQEIFKYTGFYNFAWSAKNIGKIVEDVEDNLYEGIITPKDVIHFIDNLQFYGFGMISVVMTSMTEKTSFILPEVQKGKKELVEKYKDKIKEGDPFVAVTIEDELKKIARKAIGDDVGMSLYDSGAKASFDNNYKNLYLIKGAVKDTTTGKYNIITDNYTEGITKSDNHIIANAQTEAAYSKGKGTQIGGYIVKKYLAAFQSIVLDSKGSFCNTCKTIKIKITNDNKGMFRDRYIKEGNKKVILTKTTINNYIDKYVDMYDPTCCIGDKICNICAGDSYYKLGIKNIGLTSTKIGSILLNKKMKNFHDTTLKVKKLTNADLDSIIIE